MHLWFSPCPTSLPPQVSQLYYDNNTGMYYYYDAESGRYQFHSRIEVSAGQAPEEGAEDHKASLKKGKKWKTAGEKSLRKDDKVGDLTSQRMQ